jgi:hypothetical protein
MNRRWRIGLTGVVLVGAIGWRSVANINLELRPIPEPCATRTLAIGLYAVSDSEESQSTAAMDVILRWDPAVLTLQGTDPSGTYPYAWMFSGFMDDTALDGLNVTWSDGDALYTALAPFGNPPAWAPPEGLLVTRFLFRKVHVGTSTTLWIDEGAPNPPYMYARTVVYDGFIPAYDVTGTLGSTAVIPAATGDMNCDGAINNFDINPFVLALTNPAAYYAQHPDCNLMNGDCNCDGAVNNFDINPFVSLLAGS